MTIKSINREQRRRLLALDLSGKGGKENEIAAALGHERNHKPLVDANCPDTGILYEYKKQSGTQWFDLHKLSGLTEEQRKVNVLSSSTKTVGSSACSRQLIKVSLMQSGSSASDWNWAKKAPKGAQVKYALKLNQIEKFTCLFSANQ